MCHSSFYLKKEMKYLKSLKRLASRIVKKISEQGIENFIGTGSEEAELNLIQSRFFAFCQDFCL